MGDGSREPLITAHRNGFGPGYTAITRAGDGGLDLDFGIHVLQRGERLEVAGPHESAWVLLDGSTTVDIGGGELEVERRSLFDAAPTVVHRGPETEITIRAQSDRVEWAVASTDNARSFAPRLFRPAEVEPEYRGFGLAQGACLRNVRLVFDRRLRPESNLVLGEVVNYPGRWSSYPPHHHPQPEIYHYRFSAPQGYGHGEVGDRVYRLQQYDTLRIPALHDHAQVAAPGYAMYYLWIVRHLDGLPYEGFEYTPEHTWMLDPAARVWEPSDGGPADPRARGGSTKPDASSPGAPRGGPPGREGA
jgi:5-deoxy-glucuronate isomerase